MKRRIIYGIFLMLIMVSSCTKDDWLGVLIGQQPRFYEDDTYDKQLNVFVILRQDSLGGLSETVFEVSRTRMAVGDTLSDEDLLWGTDISLFKLAGETKDDSTRLTWFRPDSLETVVAPIETESFIENGNQYAVEIIQDGFDALTASCTFPAVPQLEGSVERQEDFYTFRLKHDPSIYLYEVYLIYGDQPGAGTRIEINSGGEFTEVTIENAFPESPPSHIMVYGYDENLTTYYAYSNVFIKPNTYRPPFTTVNGGYGCFGAVSELLVELP